MKKKILALLLMMTLVFGVTACGGDVADNNASDNVDNSVDADEDADMDTDEDANEEVVESEGTLVFDVPEGFVWDEEANAYKNTDENILANINSLANPNDGSFGATTQDVMEEALETTLSNTYGETIDLTVTKWDNIKVDGYDAISYEIEYVFSGLDVVQAQVIVDGTEKLHFVTFTYLKNEGYQDKFAACIDSFRFE